MKYSQDEIVSYVYSNWNFCIILIYAYFFNISKLTILHNSNLSLKRYLKTDIGNFNIDFIQCNNPASKISAFYKIKKILFNNRNTILIKFTNFHFFLEKIHKSFAFKKVIFLDDGTTFINIAEESLLYTSKIKLLFKRLVWPKDSKFSFNSFDGIDEAFIFNLDLVINFIDKHETNFQEFSNFFSFKKLKIISLHFFNYEIHKKAWKEAILKCDCVMLGSSLIEHGLKTKNQYLLMLNKIKSQYGQNILYKPHPHEENYDEIKNYFLVVNNFDKLPLELLLIYGYPKILVSFGSTSSFLCGKHINDMESYIFVPNHFYTNNLQEVYKKINEHNIHISSIDNL